VPSPLNADDPPGLSGRVVGVAIITARPVLASLDVRFTTYDIVCPPQWTGLANSGKVVGEQGAWSSCCLGVYAQGPLSPQEHERRNGLQSVPTLMLIESN
jgi:hypothetical protein